MRVKSFLSVLCFIVIIKGIFFSESALRHDDYIGHYVTPWIYALTMVYFLYEHSPLAKIHYLQLGAVLLLCDMSYNFSYTREGNYCSRGCDAATPIMWRYLNCTRVYFSRLLFITFFQGFIPFLCVTMDNMYLNIHSKIKVKI